MNQIFNREFFLVDHF